MRAAPRSSSPPTTGVFCSGGTAAQWVWSTGSWCSTHDRPRRLATFAQGGGQPLAGAAALAGVRVHHRPGPLHRRFVRARPVHAQDDITLYLDPQTTEPQAKALSQQLQARGDLEVNYIDPAAALRRLRSDLGELASA